MVLYSYRSFFCLVIGPLSVFQGRAQNTDFDAFEPLLKGVKPTQKQLVFVNVAEPKDAKWSLQEQGGYDDYGSCSATFYENGCTYYRDDNCNVVAKSCD